MKDSEILAEWIAAGGRHHGPNTETVTMPLSAYVEFRNKLGVEPTDAYVDAMCKVVAEECGESFVQLDFFTQNALRETQRKAIAAGNGTL